MKKFLMVAIASLLIPAGAFAATLSGDTVIFDLDPNDAPRSYVVGAGIDGVIGAYDLDFNAGINGDEFVWFSNFDNVSTGGNSTLILSSLDFDMGRELVGFNLIETAFTNLDFSTTADSVTFSWDFQGTTPVGNVIKGQFVTADVAVVPLPASLPLVFAGLGALVMLRRRRKPT